MVEIFDKNRLKIAIMQNAYNVSVTQTINAVDFLDFTIPITDSKIKYCDIRNLVKWDDVVYRIVSVKKDTEGMTLTYHCEHVIAKLIDSVLFGYHVIGGIGIPTRNVLNYVLSGQQDFLLDRCAFSRQFEYGWEQENRLTALFNVPSRFVDSYIWRFDTSRYPYRISLDSLRTSGRPDHYLRARLNLLSIAKQSDSTQICTRLYPLGAGEGVNQLKIDGNYIQSPSSIIDKYGIVERVWIDRRYTDKSSLLQSAQAILEGLQEPYIEYQVKYAELNTQKPVKVGDVVEIIDIQSGEKFNTYVVSKAVSVGDIPNSTINIANKPMDVTNSIADLADRQRIEMAYSQGATQLYAQSLQGNADKTEGLLLDFFIPAEATIINSVYAKIRVGSFRAFSRATEGGGSASKTTSSGGATSQTTSGGGGISKSTADGGGISKSTADGGGISKSTADGGAINKSSGSTGIDFSAWGKLDWRGLMTKSAGEVGGGAHRHEQSYQYIDFSNTYLPSNHSHLVQAPKHSHSVSVPSHKHDFSAPKHSHSVSIPTHTHGFSVPSHTHGFSIPDHTHAIDAGIYRFGNPSGFTIYVEGKPVAYVNSREKELDITRYLIGSDGKIPRGRYLSINIVPNDKAYITISLSLQAYIQSRGNMTV